MHFWRSAPLADAPDNGVWWAVVASAIARTPIFVSLSQGDAFILVRIPSFMREYKLVNRVLAAVSFLVAFVTYTMTLQPSVPFWDCGEFSAATVWQQVPHPPGAPLWLIVGKWFHLLPIGDDGWRLNFFSGVCTAVTVMLVYLITVKLIERWSRPSAERPIVSYLGTFGGGLIAALAFTFSDTNWFNAVESEVYAAGNLLIALVIYFMMRWDDEAETPRHERWLLLIAYILGLSIGVHLLALLTVPAVAMVIYFRRYQPKITTFLALMAITGASFFIIYKAPLSFIPKLLADNAMIGVLILAALIGLVWWAVKEQKHILYIATMSFLLIILGYTSYTQILLRANAHPPMNENEPDTFTELVSYLGREQYGNRGAWPRRQETDQYYRQYQDQYGEWFEPVGQNDDGTYRYDKINGAGELKFMMEYQMYHMYFRYLFWNFVGRVSDVQDAGVAAFGVSEAQKQRFINDSGYGDVFPITFYGLPLLLGLIGMFYHYKRDWKMALTYTALFLFLGILATLQQNQQQPQPRERDYFYVGSFMIFAIWIGIGATGIAQTLRDRRRSSEAAEATKDPSAGHDSGYGLAAAALAVCLLIAPVNMAIGGWSAHDRSGNWVPWDYAYNILQSCEQDAILFTNGDNDTFPLWYLQDVAGVRRDIRVVNLSLGNTLWYIWQLKNEQPWGSKKVPINFPDEMLKVPERDPRALSYDVGAAPNVEIDVPANVMAWATNGKSNAAGKMAWTLRGSQMGERTLVRVQDKLIRNILENNRWQRPVYFSTTVGGDAWAGLESFFRSEGMAFRVMPVNQAGLGQIESINADIMRKCLLNPLPDDVFHTKPHYGFKFRNLTNPSVFFLEDHRRIPNLQYRPMYLGLAMHELMTAGNKKGALDALDALERTISPELFPIAYPYAAQISQLYQQAGAPEKARKYAEITLKSLEGVGPDNRFAQSYNPIQIKAQMLAVLGRHDEAVQTYRDLQSQYPTDPNLRAEIENLRVEKYMAKNDTAGAARELEKIIAEYSGQTDPGLLGNVQTLRQRLAQLRGQTPDNTSTAVTDSGNASGSNTSGAIGR
jgi:tetratricopeptide (TPR) repeat protein